MEKIPIEVMDKDYIDQMFSKINECVDVINDLNEKIEDNKQSISHVDASNYINNWF